MSSGRDIERENSKRERKSVEREKKCRERKSAEREKAILKGEIE